MANIWLIVPTVLFHLYMFIKSKTLKPIKEYQVIILIYFSVQTLS